LDAGGGRILWLMTGARPGYSTLIGATADLSRTLVHSVNATDVKAESMNPVGERIVRAAFTVTAQHRGRSVVPPWSSDR
jgi:D-alanyl-D-alanine carboxypeptidase